MRFADSFYYLALLNRRDAFHQKAVELSQTLAVETLTTIWVLTEVADALSHTTLRQGALQLIDRLRSDPGCLITPVSQDLLFSAPSALSA